MKKLTNDEIKADITECVEALETLATNENNIPLENLTTATLPIMEKVLFYNNITDHSKDRFVSDMTDKAQKTIVYSKRLSNAFMTHWVKAPKSDRINEAATAKAAQYVILHGKHDFFVPAPNWCI